MGSEKNNIDKLYAKKFSKFESQISTDDWAKLSTKLSKTNFLKFSFTTFNAYFLSAIVTFAAAATYFGINNLSLSNKIETLEDKIEVLQDLQNKNEIEPLLIDTFDIEEPSSEIQPETNEDELTKVKPVERTHGLNLVTKNLLEKDSVTLKIDTSKVVQPDTSSVEPKKIIRRIKKKVYIKKDKVIIKDTVTVKKKE